MSREGPIPCFTPQYRLRFLNLSIDTDTEYIPIENTRYPILQFRQYRTNFGYLYTVGIGKTLVINTDLVLELNLSTKRGLKGPAGSHLNLPNLYPFFLFIFLQHLGPSALAGIATVILIFPLNGYIAKKRSKLQVLTTLFSPPSTQNLHRRRLSVCLSVRPQLRSERGCCPFGHGPAVLCSMSITKRFKDKRGREWAGRGERLFVILHRGTTEACCRQGGMCRIPLCS